MPADTEGPKNKNGPGQPPSNSLFPDDISWTAAYPLIVNWLHLYYGDLSTVKDHWEALKLWTDGQKRQMLPGDGLPSFFQWGVSVLCLDHAFTVCRPLRSPLSLALKQKQKKQGARALAVVAMPYRAYYDSSL